MIVLYERVGDQEWFNHFDNEEKARADALAQLNKTPNQSDWLAWVNTEEDARGRCRESVRSYIAKGFQLPLWLICVDQNSGVWRAFPEDSEMNLLRAIKYIENSNSPHYRFVYFQSDCEYSGEADLRNLVESYLNQNGLHLHRIANEPPLELR